jgi:hypothetical protein
MLKHIDFKKILQATVALSFFAFLVLPNLNITGSPLVIKAVEEVGDFLDIGLRVFDGDETISVAIYPEGDLTSPLRIGKDGVTYSILLVDPDDPMASDVKIQTDGGEMAFGDLAKVPQDDGDPTTIGDCEELQLTIFEANNTYTLTNDIDCSSTNPAFGGSDSLPAYADSIWSQPLQPGDDHHVGFRPLQRLDYAVQTVFDGQEFAIQNVYIEPRESLPDQVNSLGLFHTVGNSSEIRNLKVTDIYINGGERYIGGLIAVIERATVDNVFVGGNITMNPTGSFNRAIGGVVGYATDDSQEIASISNVISDVDFDIDIDEGASSGDRIGGVVGYLGRSDGISQSGYTGSIDVRGTFRAVGGVVGVSDFSGVERSFAIANITSESGGASGLVGEQIGTGRVSDSFAIVDFDPSGEVPSAGLVGGGIHVGGSYAVSESNQDLDGITSNDANCSASYWNTDTSEQTDTDCSFGEGRTTLELLDVGTYAGSWDFDAVDVDGDVAIWKKISPTHYPCLEWMDDSMCVEGISFEELVNPDDDVTTISSCEELQITTFDQAGTYTLLNDIDCSATNMADGGYSSSMWSGDDVHYGFRPLEITGSSRPIFNGDGFAIQNVYISPKTAGVDNLGIFGNIGNGLAEIQNIVIDNVLIENGGNNTGGLVASMDAGTIRNVSVSGLVNASGNYAGMVSGKTNGTVVRDTIASGIVNGGTAYTGGMIGDMTGGSIHESFSHSTVEGASSYLGGLVGYLHDGASIYNSATFGNVGGVGARMIGLSMDASVNRSFSAGSSSRDGLIGFSIASSCFGNYWDTGSTPDSGGNCGEGNTTSQMLDQSTYSNFDFDTKWKKPGSTYYPCLQWMDDSQCVEAN